MAFDAFIACINACSRCTCSSPHQKRQKSHSTKYPETSENTFSKEAAEFLSDSSRIVHVCFMGVSFNVGISYVQQQETWPHTSWQSLNLCASTNAKQSEGFKQTNTITQSPKVTKLSVGALWLLFTFSVFSSHDTDYRWPLFSSVTEIDHKDIANDAWTKSIEEGTS